MNMAGSVVGLLKTTSSCRTAMGKAIAFGLIIVIFAVLMPDVFHAASTFLLVLFNKATAMVNALPAQPAMVGRMVR